MTNKTLLPAGSVTSSSYLATLGLDKLRLSRMAKAGALYRLAHGVYQVPRQSSSAPGPADPWELLLSLKNLEHVTCHAGAGTALSLHGYSHYLPLSDEPVHAYGHGVPQWAGRVETSPALLWHDSKLFTDPDLGVEDRSPLALKIYAPSADWVMPLATPERAILEMVDQLPGSGSLHVADMVMQSLSTLRPRLLSRLMESCTKKATLRLFMVLAERHGHPWMKRLDVTSVQFGRGNRVLYPGGKLNRKWQLTLPGQFETSEEEDGSQR